MNLRLVVENYMKVSPLDNLPQPPLILLLVWKSHMHQLS